MARIFFFVFITNILFKLVWHLSFEIISLCFVEINGTMCDDVWGLFIIQTQSSKLPSLPDSLVCEMWMDWGTEINSSQLWTDHASASRGRFLPRSLWYHREVFFPHQHPYTEVVHCLCITLAIVSVLQICSFCTSNILWVCFSSSSLSFFLKKKQKNKAKHFQMMFYLFPSDFF